MSDQELMNLGIPFNLIQQLNNAANFRKEYNKEIIEEQLDEINDNINIRQNIPTPLENAVVAISLNTAENINYDELSEIDLDDKADQIIEDVEQQIAYTTLNEEMKSKVAKRKKRLGSKVNKPIVIKPRSKSQEEKHVLGLQQGVRGLKKVSRSKTGSKRRSELLKQPNPFKNEAGMAILQNDRMQSFLRQQEEAVDEDKEEDERGDW
jgi:hypothetical protein